MKKALIFQGGWDGHDPVLVANRFKNILEADGFVVDVYDSQDCLSNLDDLLKLDLIVACWTMGEISAEHCNNVSKAVASGVGLAGCHGGMCDAFRQNTEWQFMTGGQWVSHPGSDGLEYEVNIHKGSSSIIEGLQNFKVATEHYYLHIDPSIEVLASTRFPLFNYYHTTNKPIDMPVAWTKFWGHGRVFYTALGHKDDVFDKFPTSQEIMRRGMIWAAGSRELAIKNNLSIDEFDVSKSSY